MTPQEIDRIQNAINHIKTAVDVDPWAVEIAVKAMQKQIPQKTQKDLQPTCNNLATDCISRQAAIDAIKTSRYLVDAMEKIIRLPSAQPNLQPTCNKLATVANDICVPCKDSISRQAVTDLFDAWEAAELDHHIPKILRDRLKTIQSVQPEIIRCRDCKHYMLKPQVNSNNCYIRHCTRSALISSKPDDYCSWAERRTDG